ncbi:MAG TPA: penicillin-binding transpeptidase domain-containing protein [Baekduia sp.]|nr:penicillin-binding transpeptidase domain-containing protein [Baekduia sp.]
MWLEPGRRSTYGSGRRRRRSPAVFLVPLVLLAVAGAAVALFVRNHQRAERQRAGAERYARAWTARDAAAMWATLDPASRRAYPLARFKTLLHDADQAATVTAVRTGAVRDPSGGEIRLPVAVRTRWFGTLRGSVVLPLDDQGHVRWDPHLRLPGLRRGESPHRKTLRSAHQGRILTSDGHKLANDNALAIFAPGLKKQFATRLKGHPGAELRFGSRRIRRVAPEPGRSIHSTMNAALQRVATAALGSRLGGVAVLRPSDGSVLALAGIAVSAPQPPGSTFKIITASAALQTGVATPSSTFPVQTGATLSGVRLANASDEQCGGTLVQSFAKSCNSVFAPLGAKVGAKRLMARARAFGFGEQPRVPAAKPSTLGTAKDLSDDLAVGSAAIGQNKDLATPLEMASVAAAIGNDGVRAKPRVVREQQVVKRRAVTRKVAGQVRDMMLAVVRGGTGTAAALPGVEVAGKTGTAELRFTGGGTPDPKNTDAWFVAFAPAGDPDVAVGVMLVGAGAGGAAAAPIARQVLAAAVG